MGYFNFAYKLMRMFSMLGFFYRRHKKLCKILVIILLALLTFHYLSVNGYCAQGDTTYTTDTSYFILEEYQNLVNDFVITFDKLYGKDSDSTLAFDTIFNWLQNGQYFYLYTTNLNSGNIFIHKYQSNFTKTLVDTSLVYNDYTRIPSTAYNITLPSGNAYYQMSRWSSLTRLTYENDYNIAVPLILMYRTPIEIIECMRIAGYGVENQNAIDIKELLEEQNNKLNSIDNSLQDMTSEEVEEGVVDIPEVNINDPTENGFNNIYTSVINYLGFDYATNHTYWTFSIPFINKNITYMARSYACCI